MITEKITETEIRKIFDNKDRKISYLINLFEYMDEHLEVPRPITAIDGLIKETWNYDISKDIIRQMFFNSEKFVKGMEGKNVIDYLIEDWDRINLGSIEWPFYAMNFDGHVARLNRREDLSELEKDNIISEDVIKFRRIKDINTKRNDYIESLIVLHNENIIPTFRHNRGLDFYIDGQPFDQKVSRSVGAAFIKEYGNDYYQIALDNPNLVAQSLYKNQDEERFDDDPRLYVVYMDNNISSEAIEQSIIDTDFNSPIEIEFEYRHSNRSILIHRTYCYILLLHN